ncbi:DUF5017 domain-containing protein [Sphingobacterium sp. SGG-5]|uniref:DUF5017 domain-containing protein n=1 Tax=Sphingobacterium sp. SGG-5 TaxID=2710881 RepID=UPI0013EDCBEB|nr:DUF5017 domain-containing protein [Sphingobacterium sp. SGG-5]NGM63216.1 DUF5017 domain-containing protein [Sphingobacterium sp. SGG-5]
MKANYILVSLFISCTWFSCEKTTVPKAPEFDAKVPSSIYKVGDSIIFNLEGNPDVITFYSGENGAAYSFKGQERVYAATTGLSFYSAMYAGDNPECAALKYSTDYTGVYTPEAIRQATWVDITDRFHIPPINGTAAVLEPSGEKDISDIFPDETTPVYFAWFFTTNENSGRTRFQIRDFEVKGIVTDDPDVSGVTYDFLSCGFQMIKGEGFEIQDHETTTPRVTEAMILWDGVFANTSFKEGWAVSLPIYPTTEVNLGRDYGVGIKSALDARLLSHGYVYRKPGNYRVTFVAADANAYGKSEVVKHIDITVIP